jgi:uncharacterized membrane protein YuzA (DUF378 family)
MKPLDIASIFLLILGGIIFGLIGLFEFNPIEFIFRPNDPMHIHHHPGIISKMIYILIGASAVYQIVQRKAIIDRIKKQ